MLNKFALVAMIMTLVSCAKSAGDACSTMQNMGFTQCQVTDRSRFSAGFSGCHTDDLVAYTVTAVNPQGQQVTATVCCGNSLYGSCTIRN